MANDTKKAKNLEGALSRCTFGVLQVAASQLWIHAEKFCSINPIFGRLYLTTGSAPKPITRDRSKKRSDKDKPLLLHADQIVD
jgi:hypothetical protein